MVMCANCDLLNPANKSYMLLILNFNLIKALYYVKNKWVFGLKLALHNSPKPHTLTSSPLHSGIFIFNKRFLIGLVSSIFTAVIAYFIRFFLLYSLDYDIWSNLDNVIPSLSYFCSIGGIRYVINEYLNQNIFSFSTVGNGGSIPGSKENIIESSTTFKMVDGNKDQISSNLENKSEDFSFDKMDSLLKKLQTQIEEIKNIRTDHTFNELNDLNDKLNKWEQFCTRDLTRKLSSLAEYNSLFTTDEIVQLMVYADRLGKPARTSSSCINVEEYIDIQTNLASNSKNQYTTFWSHYSKLESRMKGEQKIKFTSLIKDLSTDVDYKLQTKLSILNDMRAKSRILDELVKNKK